MTPALFAVSSVATLVWLAATKGGCPLIYALLLAVLGTSIFAGTCRRFDNRPPDDF